MTNIQARNLKLLREQSGFTQEQMAEYLGVKRSAYSNYETGDRETPEEVLVKSAELLGCERELLSEQDEQMVRSGMMACAFRADGLSTEDMREVARFKRVVLEYLKINKLLSE